MSLVLICLVRSYNAEGHHKLITTQMVITNLSQRRWSSQTYHNADGHHKLITNFAAERTYDPDSKNTKRVLLAQGSSRVNEKYDLCWITRLGSSAAQCSAAQLVKLVEAQLQIFATCN